MRNHLLTAVAVLAAVAPGARADTVAGVPYGAFLDTEQYGYGQAFTTAAGSSYDDITFNFYTTTHTIAPPFPYYYRPDPNYPTTPFAIGTGYLLSQPYLGIASALGPSAPGFLASAVASNNVYTFAPSLTLSGNTQYYLYENTYTPLNTVIIWGDPIGQGPEYNAFDPNYFYQDDGTATSYLVTGVAVAATPEPSGIVLLGSGMLALAGTVRRRMR